MKKLITVIALFAMMQGMAQEKGKNKVVFHSINQAGLLEGEGGHAFQIQTVNGIKIKSFFTGIGIGIDEYHTRSIPLFLDIRKDLKQTGKTPFIYADAGTHFIWPKGKDEWVHYENAGLFYDFGIGYKIPVKTNAVLLSAGYSFKSVSSKENRYYYWWNYYPEDYIYYDYKLRRVSIKVGFAF
jgi:hypothetical protein